MGSVGVSLMRGWRDTLAFLSESAMWHKPRQIVWQLQRTVSSSGWLEHKVLGEGHTHSTRVHSLGVLGSYVMDRSFTMFAEIRQLLSKISASLRCLFPGLRRNKFFLLLFCCCSYWLFQVATFFSTKYGICEAKGKPGYNGQFHVPMQLCCNTQLVIQPNINLGVTV